MRFYSLSVGKKCNFCHVKIKGQKSLDFVSDANPQKLISRKMMLMTNKINKRFFKYEKSDTKNVIQSVTCYTCHNGQAHPETRGKVPSNKQMFPRDGDKPITPDSIRAIQGDR